MEGKASPRREFKQSRNRKLKALARSNNNGGVAVSRANEGGVLRMKIVVRKQDLKQMLGMLNGKNNVTADYNCPQSSPSPPSVEERLNLLPRKYLLRCNAFIKKSRHCWSPELQSIPEE
ncbi:hypothetical protein V6N13_018376 [Hibiscus sabdariffa]|uniref:Uncharacterized protein n=2 Tax=Hibiscus sabdariffa TaxID=183260 RepID=A0ABR1ZN68_9ROSI